MDAGKCLTVTAWRWRVGFLGSIGVLGVRIVFCARMQLSPLKNQL
jgi:hypothetical protein